MRLGPLFLLISCFLGPIGCLQDGRFTLDFDFPDAAFDPETAPFVVVRVEERAEAINRHGPILASVGPFKLVRGRAAIEPVPYGRNRVVIVEAREGEALDSQVLYYGISERFSLEQNDELVVKVAVEPTRPPLGSRVFLLGSDGRPHPGPVRTRALRLGLVTQTGAVVQVSNRPGFIPVHTLEAEMSALEKVDTATRGESFSSVRWDLQSDCETARCSRTIYTRFIDDNGYASRALPLDLVLDQRAPGLAGSVGPVRGLAADGPVAVQVISDEPLARPPRLSIVGHPSFELLLQPSATEQQRAFQYRSNSPAGVLPLGPTLEVVADLRDLAGNTQEALQVDHFFVSDGPEILDPGVTPALAKLGDIVTISFGLEEAYLPEHAIAIQNRRYSVLVDGKPVRNDAASGCEATPHVGRVNYRCAHRLGPDALPEALTPRLQTVRVEVRAKDAVGIESLFSTPLLIDYERPAVQTRGFAPPFARLGQGSTFTLSLSEALREPPHYVIEPQDPGFRLERSDGLSYTYRLPQDHGAGDGVYRLRTVRVEDLAGNVSTASIGAVLRIDRQPPTLQAFTLGRRLGTSFQPTAVFRADDEINLCFAADEPVEVAATLSFVGRAPQAVPCDLEPKACGGQADKYVCRYALSDRDVLENQVGAGLFSITARDIVENVSLQDVALRVDRRAPRLTLARFTPQHAKVGTRVQFELRFDEPLKAGSLPDYEIQDRHGHPLPLRYDAVQSSTDSGALYRFHVEVGEASAGVPDGVYVLRSVGATDRVGNQRRAMAPADAWVKIDRQKPTIGGLAVVEPAAASGSASGPPADPIRVQISRARAGRDVEIRFQSAEPLGADQVTVNVDAERLSGCTAVPLGSTSGPQDWRCPFRTPALVDAEHRHEIIVVTQDAAGNSDSAQSFLWTDEKAPTATAEWNRRAARFGTAVELVVRAQEPLAELPVIYPTNLAIPLSPVPVPPGAPRPDVIRFRGVVPLDTTSGTISVDALGLVDLLGNEATPFNLAAPAELWIDGGEPEIQLINPPDSIDASGHVVLQFQITDDDDAPEVSATLLGHEFFEWVDAQTYADHRGCRRSDALYECHINLAAMDPGGAVPDVEALETLRITATDRSGNLGLTDHILLVDTVPPEVQSARVRPSLVRAGGLVQLEVEASDDATITQLTWTGPTQPPFAGEGLIQRYEVGDIPDGHYRLVEVEVMDGARNAQTYRPGVDEGFEVDRVAPTISDLRLDPPQINHVGRTTVSFALEGYDPGSPVEARLAPWFAGTDLGALFTGVCTRAAVNGRFSCEIDVSGLPAQLRPNTPVTALLHIGAQDPAGNRTQITRPVPVDMVGPDLARPVIEGSPARRGSRITLSAEAAEPGAEIAGLQWLQVLAAPSASGTTTVPAPQVEFSGAGLRWHHSAGAESGRYRLQTITLVDAFDNPRTHAATGIEFVVDVDPPILELTVRARRNAGTFIAGPEQPIGFEVASSEAGRLDLSFGEQIIFAQAAIGASSQFTVSSTLSVPADFIEVGTVDAIPVVGFFFDEAGNHAVVDELVVVDFRPPEVIGGLGTLVIQPPSNSLAARHQLPVTAATCCADASELELQFTIDEPVEGPRLQLRRPGMAPIPILGSAQEGQLSNTFFYSGAQPSVPELPAGEGGEGSVEYEIYGTFVDQAGNRAELPLAVYKIDTQAPAMLDRTKVLHERIPWGAELTGGSPEANLWFEPGAIPADDGTARRLLVFAEDPASVGIAFIARTAIDAPIEQGILHGQATPFLSLPGDRDYPELFVTVIDEAGNHGPRQNIYRGRYVATMNESINTPRNPHRVVKTPALRDALLQDPERTQVVSALEKRRLGRIGDQDDDGEPETVRAVGERSWMEISQDYVAGEPPPRAYPAYTYDAKNGRLLMFGGRLVANETLTRETWEWDGRKQRRLTVAGGAPSARERAAMAYCRDGSFVLFGGTVEGGAASSELWRLDGEVWTPVVPEPGAPWPAARSMHSLTYVNGLTLMYGGRDDTDRPMGDLWLWDGQGWTQLSADTVNDAGPAARWGHGAVFDRYEGRLILAGGYTAAGASAESWSLEPGTCVCGPQGCVECGPGSWTRFDAGSLPALGEVELAVDRPSGQIYAIGSAGVGDPAGRLPVFRTASASDLSVRGWSAVTSGEPMPYARRGAVLTYQIETNQMMIYGGEGSRRGLILVHRGSNTGPGTTPAVVPPAHLNGAASAVAQAAWGDREASVRHRLTTYFDDHRFTPVQPQVWPTSRVGHRMLYNPDEQATLLVGGANTENTAGEPGHGFYWTGQSWWPHAGLPTALFTPSAAIGWTHDRGANEAMGLVYGGLADAPSALAWYGTDPLQTVVLSPERIAERRGGVMAYLEFEGQWVLFGGREGDTFISETHVSSDGVNWHFLGGSRTPSPRVGHAMVYDPVNRQIVLFGGYDADDFLRDDTWVFSQNTWRRGTKRVEPPARMDHGLAFDSVRRRVTLVGGRDNNNRPIVDGWEWDGEDWTALPLADVRGPSEGSQIAFDDRRQTLVAVHGKYGRSVWELSPQPSRVPALMMSVNLTEARFQPEWRITAVTAEAETSALSGGALGVLPAINLGRHGIIAPVLARKGRTPPAGPVGPFSPPPLPTTYQRSNGAVLRLWNDSLQSWTKTPEEIVASRGLLLGEEADFVTPDNWLHALARPTLEADGLVDDDPDVAVDYVEIAVEYEQPSRATP